jgi:hypothetical protein
MSKRSESYGPSNKTNKRRKIYTDNDLTTMMKNFHISPLKRNNEDNEENNEEPIRKRIRSIDSEFSNLPITIQYLVKKFISDHPKERYDTVFNFLQDAVPFLNNIDEISNKKFVLTYMLIKNEMAQEEEQFIIDEFLDNYVMF